MNRKFLLSSLLCLLTAQVSWAEPTWYSYDPDRRVNWFHGGGFQRAEFHWWIENTGYSHSSDLYLNGVYQSSEYGTNDIGLLDAWAFGGYGWGSIRVVDLNSAHGQRVKAIAQKVSGAETRIWSLSRLYPDDIAAGITGSVALGYKIIVVTTGFNFPHAGLSNACRYAESNGAMIFCAVPNAGVNIDVTPDYPSSWAHEITSIVPVTSTDRNGNLYGPGAAAWGTNVIGAPGRNIIGGETYSSGASSAAPIVAGCMSLLMEHRPGHTLETYRNALWSTCVPAVGTYRIDAGRLLTEGIP